MAAMDAWRAESHGLRHGLREGIALAELKLPLPEVWQVRRASVTALASRFSTWDARRAARRVEMSRAILASPTRP